MKIVRKREVATFIKNFEVFAQWDGEKYYFVIDTVNPKGTVTIMKYEIRELISPIYTYHRTNELYSDIKELPVDIETLKDLIWINRKAINQSMKVTVR